MTLRLAGPLLLVGAGKMGGALLEGWLRQGLDPAAVFLQDPAPAPEVLSLAARHACPIPAPANGQAVVAGRWCAVVSANDAPADLMAKAQTLFQVE